jgi:single-stranded DNA-binding protein
MTDLSLCTLQVFVAGKLVQRTWQGGDGNKRQTVENQVTHVGPDLQFATAEVARSSAEGSRSSRTVLRLRPRPRKADGRSRLR